MKQDFPQQNIMKDKLGYLTTEQIKRIYRACNTDRDEVLVRLLWMTGRRISEILSLRVKDIDWERKLINWVILKKKNPMRAQKTIDDKTLQLLAWYIRHKGLEYEHYVLHSYDRNKPLSRVRAFQIVRSLGKRAGILQVGSTKIHPHHFRHSRAMRIAKEAKSPADIKNIQKILEHSSLAMTENYLGFAEEDTRRLIEVE